MLRHLIIVKWGNWAGRRIIIKMADKLKKLEKKITLLNIVQMTCLSGWLAGTGLMIFGEAGGNDKSAAIGAGITIPSCIGNIFYW